MKPLCEFCLNPIKDIQIIPNFWKQISEQTEILQLIPYAFES